MTFNANYRPVDVSGMPITVGKYRVQRGGQVRLADVFEDPETLSLLAKFEDQERVQRVDELSQHCCWSRAEDSESAA